MLKVTSCKETPKGVELTIEYAFTTGKSAELQSVHDSKENAYRHFVATAFEYLLFQVDDFQKAMWMIKKHWFDRNSTPYFHADDGWRACFWKMHDLKQKLNELPKTEVYQYAQFIQKNLRLFYLLIPQFKELGHKEITIMHDDINTISDSIMKTIRALHDGTITTQNQVA